MKLEELGRRAVACPRWRWLPGMRITQSFSPLGWRLHTLHESEEWRAEDVRGTKLPTHPNEPWLYPDFSDPATLGCLLHLVREAHEDVDIVAFVVHSHGSPERWCVDVGPAPDLHDERKYVYRPTEAEALVAALEAAP